MAVVAFKPGRVAPNPRSWLSSCELRVAGFWIPECWAVVAEIPKTSVGKQNKKLLRALHAEGRLEVQRLAHQGSG